MLPGANLKIDRLMLAMRDFEGWQPPTENPPFAGSKSYRNHNPLNLTSSPFQSGMKDGMAVFKDDTIGFLAAQWDIMQKAKGETITGLNGNSTIADLIAIWSRGESAEVLKNYVNTVVKNSGLPPTTKLSELFS